MNQHLEIKDSNNSYPGVYQSFTLGVFFIIVTLGLGFVFSLFETNINLTWVFAVIYFISLSLVLVFALTRKRAVEPSFQFSVKGYSFVTIILITASTISFVFILDYLFLFIPFVSDIESDFALINNWSFLSFFTIIIAPAILEELLFRGIILDGLVNRYSKISAIVISSFFFGLFHLDYVQSIWTFFLGLFIGWIYVVSKKGLLLVILIHATNNLISWLIFNTYGTFSIYEIMNYSNNWLLALLAGSVFILMIFLINKKFHSIEPS